MAAIINIDYIKSKLNPQSQVLGLSQSGFFLKNIFSQVKRYETWMRNVYKFQNVQSNSNCVEDKKANGSDQSDCIFAEELLT